MNDERIVNELIAIRQLLTQAITPNAEIARLTELAADTSAQLAETQAVVEEQRQLLAARKEQP